MSNADQNTPDILTKEFTFSPETMVECGKCSRRNPPNRLNCLYCSEELDADLTKAARRVITRKPEAWEEGYSVVIISDENTPGADLQAGAMASGIDVTSFADLVSAGVVVPVTRTASTTSAEKVAALLSELGFTTKVVSDSQLSPDQPPTRLSRIDILGSELELIDFSRTTRSRISFDDLRLIVRGTVITSEVSSIEKKARSGSKVLNESSSTSDEAVADIYVSDSRDGYRIRIQGFDFSTLGVEKGFISSRNLDLLIDRIMERAPNISVSNEYDKLRRSLDLVWEPETSTDARGIVTAGFGKKGFGKSLTTSSLGQFNRFSRLQSLLR